MIRNLKILFSGFFYGICFFPNAGIIKKNRFNNFTNYNYSSDLENFKKDAVNLKLDFNKAMSKLNDER